MLTHDRFEWDARKAEQNLAKHGVTFEQAASALADPFGPWFHLDDLQP